MFENFTFGAVSQPRYDCEMSASPTDTSFSQQPIPPSSYPFPDSGLDGIVNKFEKHSLAPDVICESYVKWDERPSALFGEYDGGTYPTPRSSTSSASSGSSTVSAPSQLTDLPSRVPLGGCRRLQRQLNVQMQCSSAHIRDINTLVENMINSSSQCRIYQPLSRFNSSNTLRRPEEIVVGTGYSLLNTGLLTPELEVDEDEAHYEEISEEISLRRASAPGGIRKYSDLRFHRSADVVWEGGKVKVKKRPKMRKRNMLPVKE